MCNQAGTNLNVPGFHTTMYTAEFLFVGLHFEDELFTFFSAIVNFTNLEEWINIIPFDYEHVIVEKKICDMTAKYSKPINFECNVPCIDAKISSDFSFTQSYDKHRYLRWEHLTFLKISPKKNKGYKWFLKNIFILRELLTLFIGNPIFERIIYLFIETKNSSGEIKKEPIQLFFTEYHDTTSKKVNTNNIIFNLPSIYDNLATILNKWYTLYDSFESVLNLLFGNIFNKNIYLEYSFLTLMQALEAYHRSLGNGHYIDQDDYDTSCESIKNAIPTDLPDDLKQSLKSRLKYGNEYSLRKRIKNLFESLNQETKDKILPKANIIRDKMVDTRNFFTHYDSAMKNKIISGTDLVYTNQLLMILLSLFLFKEIGLSEEVILTNLSNSDRFGHIIPNLKKMEFINE